MGNICLVLIGCLVFVAGLSVQGVDAEEGAPPMYAVHDFASGELQKRRSIKPENACDVEFGTDLEGIVTEMEKHKDANEEIANKLRKQFEDVMEKNKDKKLCEKLTWCDMGICRKRAKIQGRSMGGPSAPDAKPVAKPVAKSVAKPPAASPAKGPKARNNNPTEKNSKSSAVASVAVREAILFYSSTCRWIVMTIIAVVLPRNL